MAVLDQNLFTDYLPGNRGKKKQGVLPQGQPQQQIAAPQPMPQQQIMPQGGNMFDPNRMMEMGIDINDPLTALAIEDIKRRLGG